MSICSDKDPEGLIKMCGPGNWENGEQDTMTKYDKFSTMYHAIITGVNNSNFVLRNNNERDKLILFIGRFLGVHDNNMLMADIRKDIKINIANPAKGILNQNNPHIYAELVGNRWDYTYNAGDNTPLDLFMLVIEDIIVSLMDKAGVDYNNKIRLINESGNRMITKLSEK